MTTAERLAAVSENMQRVYDAGKTAEYDSFWDSYQQNGNRAEYSEAFSGHGWRQNTFLPKHRIQPLYAYRMFCSHNAGGTAYDLEAHLQELGVTLDFSKCTGFQYGFSTANLTRVGVIDCSSATAITNLFTDTQVQTVDCLVVPDTLLLTNVFTNAFYLSHIIFEGTIGKTLHIQDCPLDKESILSILNCLSSTSNGMELCLAKEAVNRTFETESGAMDGSTSEEWKNLIADKNNWVISLM